MASENGALTDTIVAGADFSTTGIYRFGVVGTDGKAELASASARADFVIYDNPTEDRECRIAVGGRVLVECGGTITAGDDVVAGANGVALASSGGTFVMGTARESGVSGDVIAIMFQPSGPIT